MDVGTSLTVDGTISVDGLLGVGSHASGGAGGSLWILAETLDGQGVLAANGAAALGTGGAGGGGRLAVSVTDNQFFGTVMVAGGTGSAGVRHGADGTIDVNTPFPSPSEMVPPETTTDSHDPREMTKGKKKSLKQTVRADQFDRRESAKKNSLKRTTKRNQVASKQLRPGNYQARYKAEITRNSKKTGASQTVYRPPSSFTIPRRPADSGCQSSLDNFGFGVRSEHVFSEIITWTGGGDGFSWSDPANWNSSAAPSGNQVAFVPVAPYRTVFINNDTEVRAILTDANVVVDGVLTINDLSVTNGELVLLPGSQLSAAGSAARFFGNGSTVIHGASLIAQNNAQIALPQVLHYDFASTAGFATRNWLASTGGVLQLPNLQTITNGQGNNSDILIQASSGGLIDLSGVTQITDPAAGSVLGSGIDVVADGIGSTVQLTSLLAFSDRAAYALTGNGQYSGLTATNFGTVALSTNAADDIALTGIRIVLDDTGILPLDRITTLTDGRADLVGNAFQFPVLTSAVRTQWFVSGVGTTIALPQLANIDGASFDIRDGVTLALTLPTTYDFASTAGATRNWLASTDGVLQLPNLQTITNGQGNNSDILIRASSGGLIDLSGVTQITDPAAGSVLGSGIDVVADGVGSTVQLTSLLAFSDRAAYALTGNGQYSGLTATNFGTVALSTNAADDIALTGVRIVLDDTGILPLDRITTLTDGRADLVGNAFQFPVLTSAVRTQWFVGGVGTTIALPQLANIDGASFDIRDGVTLALTLPTTYDFASTAGATRNWLASTGGVLQLPNLQTITNGQGNNSDILIRASSGGLIDLSGVTQITDPVSGSVLGSGIDVVADGVGSTVQLTSLLAFSDRAAYALTGNGQYSGLTATNFGTVALSTNAADDIALTGVRVVLDDTGILPLDRITTLTDGRADLVGNAFQFPVLTSAVRTQWFVSGVGTTIALPQLANIDGASFDIRDGVTLALTLPTTYDFASTAGATRNWLASTDGVLQLPNLQTITNGQGNNSDILIRASSGGLIDLSGVTQITDPVSGSVLGSGIDVVADGVGSTVQLTSLLAFSDRAAYALTGNGQYSGLTATNFGTVALSTNAADDIALTGVRVVLDDTGILPLDRITTLTDGRADLVGNAFQFPVLTSAVRTQWFVSGVGTTIALPQLANIDGASFDIRDGVTLTLPLPTTYDFSTGSTVVRSWLVSAGGQLQLPNLQTITNGQGLNTDMLIQATAGGQIDLSGVTQITDPASGDLRQSGIDVFADGTGSLVALPGLQNFIDRNTDQSSRLISSNQGVINIDLNGLLAVGVVVTMNAPRSSTPLAAIRNVTKFTEPGSQQEPPLNSPPVMRPESHEPGLVQWIGGSGDWNDPSNWSTNHVPGRFNDVIIDVPDTQIITVSGTHVVRRLTVEESINITSGTLTVTRASSIHGTLTMQPGSTLVVDGDFASLTAQSVTFINGANLQAIRGGHLSLPNLIQYDFGSGTNVTRSWLASAGGTLHLPNLQTITNGQGANTDMLIQATTGGQIDLSSVTQITDPASGNLLGSAIDVVADGVGSTVQLTSLLAFSDRAAYALTGNGQYSGLTATNFGTVALSTNAADDIALTGVRIVLDDTGTLPLDRVTTMTDSRADLVGNTFQFPVLTSAVRTQWFVSGVGTTIALPQLANIDGASFDVRDGVTLALTLPTTYDFASSAGATRNWLASTGGVLQLPNLQTITNGQGNNSDILIQASSGGLIDLSGVTQITDPAAGSVLGSGIDVVADGIGSTVQLTSLLAFSDRAAYALTGNGQYSGLTATNFGTVALSTNAADDIALTGVRVVLDDTGILPLDRVTTMTDSRADLVGNTFQFPVLTSAVRTQWFVSGVGTTIALPQLANIDGASFDVRDGVTLALTLPTTYDFASSAGATRNWLASTGGVLQLPNLQTITNGQGNNSDILIQASSGGLIDLSGVTQITDPAAGSVLGSGIDVVADGIGSTVQLTSLLAFSDRAAYALTGNGQYSGLTATNFGTVALSTNAADDIALTGVRVVLDDTGILPLDRITTLTDGRADLVGNAFQFPVLTSAVRTQWFVSGVGTTIALPQLANIDGASFDIRDGVTLALTLPTTYDFASTAGATRNWLASTDGVLQLPNLQTITNGQGNNSDILIRASSGGLIDLSGVTQITDPVSGSVLGSGIDVVADGVGSTVQLTSLLAFSDRAATR